MKLKAYCHLFTILAIFLFGFITYSQNILDTSEWKINKVIKTTQSEIDETNSNTFLVSNNHLDKESVQMLLKTSSKHDYAAWDSEFIETNPNKSYRFSIWIKTLSNNHDGQLYFGMNTEYKENNLLKLEDNTGEDLFFHSDPSSSNGKWNLLVGFIHDSKTDIVQNIGRIYDGNNAKELNELNDFKFESKPENLSLQIFYRSKSEDEIYLTEPRIDIVDGNEPSIENLLGINNYSQLFISYDNSGNIKQKFYCNVGGFAACVTPSSNAVEDAKTYDPKPDVKVLNEMQIFPNPTKGLINLRSNIGVESISVYNMNGTTLYTKEVKSISSINIDLTNYPSGMYLIHTHYENGEYTTSKIIKK